MHVAKAILARGDEVLGFDNLSDYYDVGLKEARLHELDHQSFKFVKADLNDREAVREVVAQCSLVVHLAAQAGVRYSIENPGAYVQSNLVGFANMLEACRSAGIRHLVYASSSSVYGGNTKIPFSEEDQVDHPISLYAATKKSNELMAHTYSHLFDLPTTGLRFFTVYGPWGRPDMAPILFTQAILEGTPIRVFNYGKMLRDFTYIDDIVKGVLAILDNPPIKDREHLDSEPPYKVYNIGNSQPIELMRFIEILEKELGREALRELLPMQPGDVPATFADTSAIEEAIGFRPTTRLEDGLRHFVAWYRTYYRG